jgi:hypothetical protein
MELYGGRKDAKIIFFVLWPELREKRATKQSVLVEKRDIAKKIAPPIKSVLQRTFVHSSSEVLCVTC